MDPLEYAPNFTIEYEIDPDNVRYWLAPSGRVYRDEKGWFTHPGILGPASVMAAWFFDGPMELVKD